MLMTREYNDGKYLIPTNEPLDKEPKYFNENTNYIHKGSSIDKIALNIDPDIIVPERFHNMKRGRSLNTNIVSGGYGKIYIQSEHISPGVPLWKVVHGSVSSLMKKGFFKIRQDIIIEPASSIEEADFTEQKAWTEMFLEIAQRTKIDEIEFAFDIPEDQINLGALRECSEMHEVFENLTFYSPRRYAVSSSGKRRLKHKPLLIVYNKTVKLVKDGKLPDSALMGPYLFRVELRLSSRYIERNIDKDRTIIHLGNADQFIPSFLRLTPEEAIESKSDFCKKTLNKFIDKPRVWENLDPESDLYRVLFK